MFRSPAVVYLDSDFCYCPDPMSYSTTWKNFQPPVQKPKRGLPIVSEDSKEEESDRDVRSNRKNGKERRLSEEVYNPPTRNLRISRRLLFLIIFPVVCGLLIIALHRYQSLLFHQLPKRDSVQKEKPSSSHSLPKDRLHCSHHEVLSRESDGAYFYSLEAALPMTLNQSTKYYGFYQAFSETGKPLESPKFSVLEKDDLKAMWKTEERGSMDRKELVDHYIVTIFLDQEDNVSKLQFTVHCLEKKIRHQIEDSNQKETESRREIDDRILQALICILSFILGAIISKFVPTQ